MKQDTKQNPIQPGMLPENVGIIRGDFLEKVVIG
jgi:hypothetical protein